MLSEKDLIANYPYPIVATYLNVQRVVLSRSTSKRDKALSLTTLADQVIHYTTALVVAQYYAYGLEDKEWETAWNDPTCAPVSVLELGARAILQAGFEDGAIVPAAFLQAAHAGRLLELCQTLLAFWDGAYDIKESASHAQGTVKEQSNQVSCLRVLEVMAQFGMLLANPHRSLSEDDLGTLDYVGLLAGVRALLEEMSFLVQYPLVYIEQVSASDGDHIHQARTAMGAALIGRDPFVLDHPLDENRFYLLHPQRDEPFLCLGPLIKYEDLDKIVLLPEAEVAQLRQADARDKRKRQLLFNLTSLRDIDTYSQAARNVMDIQRGAIPPSHQHDLENLAKKLGIPTWFARQIEQEIKVAAPPPAEKTPQPGGPSMRWEHALGQRVRKIAMGRLADPPGVWVITAGDESSGDSLYLIEGGQRPRRIFDPMSRVETLACSERGDVFALGCWNGQVAIFDKQGRPRRAPPALDNVVKALALSPDGSRLAVTTWGELAFLFDLEHDQRLCDVALADAGQSIALGVSVQPAVAVPKIEAAGVAATPLHEQFAQLRQNLVAYFGDEELRTLSFDLGVEYDTLPGQGKEGKARDLVTRLHQTGRISELVEMCRARRPHVAWMDIVEAHPVTAAVSSSSPDRPTVPSPTCLVAVGTYHGWITLFGTGDQSSRQPEEVGDSVVYLALAEGKVIAACADGRVTSLDGSERHLYRISGAINDLAVSRDGHKIVVAHSGRRLAFLNDAGGQLRPAHPRDPELDSEIVHIAVSDDGRWCLAVTTAGTLHVFEETLEYGPWPLGKPPVDLAISADARKLAVAFADGTLRFYVLPATLVPPVQPQLQVVQVSPSILSCSRLSVLEIQLRNTGDGAARNVRAKIDSPILATKSQPVLASLRPGETNKLQWNVRASEPGKFSLDFEITYGDDSGAERNEVSYIDDEGTMRTETRFSRQFEAI